jgi:hypothetical protein
MVDRSLLRELVVDRVLLTFSRAQGAAQANKIIGDSLKHNEAAASAFARDKSNRDLPVLLGLRQLSLTSTKQHRRN